MYDWVLFLHVLSAFVLVGASTALWVLVLATRPAAPVIGAEEARGFGQIAGPLVGVGMVGTIVFGIWLAIQHDRFQVWDGWVLAALVLWALSGWAGGQAGKEFRRDPVGGRRAGIRFQALFTLGVLAMLILMIWKPGA